jgi:hypothetical protein
MLVCGDRKWGIFNFPDGTIDTNKRRLLRKATFWMLSTIAEDTADTLIEGCAPGADRMSEEWAHDLAGRSVLKKHLHFPANWAEEGKSAGPRRNIRMLEEGKPHFVVALHDDLDNSRGTGHMVKIARAADIPVYTFTSWDVIMGYENANS